MLYHAALFLVGIACTTFKGNFSEDATLLPFSLAQLTIPAFGVVSVTLLTSPALRPRLWSWRYERRGLLFLYMLSCIAILIGAVPFIFDDPGGATATLFVLRWGLPIAAVACAVLLRILGLTYEAFIGGLLCGLFINVSMVEIFKAGVSMPTYQISGGRFAGFFSHPNQYGIVVSMLAPMWGWALNQRNLSTQAVGALGVAVSCLALMQSLSKTNIALFIACLLVSVPLLGRWTLPRLFTASIKLVVIGVLFALGAMAASNFLRDTFPREFELIEQALLDPTASTSFVERLALWEEAMAVSAKHPILGVGPEDSSHVLGALHAHNYLLHLHLQAGLLGALGIVGITIAVFAIFLTALKCNQSDSAQSTYQSTWGLATALSSLTYLAANLMSDSFNTATMSAFSVMMAFAVVSVCFSKAEDAV